MSVNTRVIGGKSHCVKYSDQLRIMYSLYGATFISLPFIGLNILSCVTLLLVDGGSINFQQAPKNSVEIHTFF